MGRTRAHRNGSNEASRHTFCIPGQAGRYKKGSDEYVMCVRCGTVWMAVAPVVCSRSVLMSLLATPQSKLVQPVRCGQVSAPHRQVVVQQLRRRPIPGFQGPDQLPRVRHGPLLPQRLQWSHPVPRWQVRLQLHQQRQRMQRQLQRRPVRWKGRDQRDMLRQLPRGILLPRRLQLVLLSVRGWPLRWHRPDIFDVHWAMQRRAIRRCGADERFVLW